MTTVNSGRYLPTFPANAFGSGPATVTKVGLTYTFGLDLRPLAAETSSVPTTSLAMVQNPTTGAFSKITLADFLANSQSLNAKLTALAGMDSVQGLVEQNGADSFTKRLIGVANSTDIPTLADADARFQPLDAGLTAIATFDATAGLVEQTGAETFTKRLIGVANATDVPTRADADGRYQPLDADLTAIAALAGTDNIYYRSGAAAWSSVTVGSGLSFTGGTLAVSASGTLPRSYLTGLALSNNGADATNDIDIASGICRASDNAADLTIAATHVKQIDVVFAEYSVIGTASGGRDSADNLTGAKWFYAYLIGGSGKNDQAFFSTSASPTLPSGFTYSRTIGSVYWTGSTVKAFTQTGDVFHWTAPALDVDVTNLGGSTTGYTLTTPTGRKCLAILNITVGDGTAATRVYVHSPDNGDDAASATANPLATTWVIVNTANSSHGAVQIMTGTTSNIRAVSSDTSTTLKIATLGFIDRRGRDD
jgi:hypothetical protein